jgi:3-methyladenine DNA glycosylase AlkC
MATPLKEHIDAGVVDTYAHGLAAAMGPAFDAEAFRTDALRGLEQLELKDRVAQVADTVHRHVGDDAAKGMAALLTMLEGKVPQEGPSSEFRWWPMAAYVERHGLDHPEQALAAMARITGFFSCEFAVRPFLQTHRERTLEELHRWARSDDVHLRRNASEGVRPRLPWGSRLNAFADDPTEVFALCEVLRNDQELYVRRSVANALNDIAKDHPARLCAWLADWSPSSPEGRWVVRHALRSLVKQGDPAALELLGFAPPRVRVESLRTDRDRYVVGETMQLHFTLVSTADEPQRLVVDHRVHYVKADGRTRPKVFKGSELVLQPAERRQVSRRQHLRPISTRRYYEGEHAVDIVVNGVVSDAVAFHLSVPSIRE